MAANNTTNYTTLDASGVAAAKAADVGVTVSLVFRWDGGEQLVRLEDGRPLVVGRADDCDVRIQDRSVSRKHASFVSHGESVSVEDLGARNGVVVRENRIAKATLHSGDWVALGNVVVSVHAAGTGPAKPDKASPDRAPQLLWSGARMAEVQRLIARIAPTHLPVLVLGETGTGKELIAHELHRQSGRPRAKLQIVNCAAIPSTLLESVLFGHERGAFTGADRTRIGVFEQAHGGSVFLDEIGELPGDAQAALLRVLETGRFSRVGSTQEIEVDVRVIAATHRDLEIMVQTEAFRLDLLHRLDVVSVRLPPLRERTEDLPPLIEHFLRAACQEAGLDSRSFDSEALEQMHRYSWPGNVRELKNLVERSVAVAEGEVIHVSDLPERVRAFGSPSVAAPAAFPYARGPSITASTLPSLPGVVEVEGTLRAQQDARERELLIQTLDQTRGDRRRASEVLGISLRTLERRLRKYGLSRAKSGPI